LCATPPPWESKGAGGLVPLKRSGPESSYGMWPHGFFRSMQYYLHQQGGDIPWTGRHDIMAHTHNSRYINSTWDEKKAVRACERAIQILAPHLRSAPPKGHLSRLRASADTLLCQLYATRFNLDQYRLVREKWEALESRTGGGPPAFARLSLDRPTLEKTYSYFGVDYRNVWFCHGPERVVDVFFLGGDAALKAQTALAERVGRNIERYRGTPWEILNRRIGLVLFRPYPLRIVTGEVSKSKPDRRDRRSRAKTPRPTKTESTPPAFTPPSRTIRTIRSSIFGRGSGRSVTTPGS
jgi:hypothetical protein